MEALVKLKDKLEDTGLSENEIGVYISLLKIGESTTGKILDDYMMSAGKVYIILNKLIKKGLVSYVIKNNVKYFKAQDPINIIDYLEQEKKKIESKETEIKNLIPDISKELMIQQDNIHVEIYEGLKGMKTAITKFVDEHEYGATEYQFDNLDYAKDSKIPENLKYMIINYNKKAAEKGVNVKILLSANTKSVVPELHKVMKGTKYKLRYVTNQKFVTMLFSEGRTLLFDFEKPSVVFLRSKSIAHSFLKMFESLWELGKEI